MRINPWIPLSCLILLVASCAGGRVGWWDKLFLEKPPMTWPEYDFSRSLDFAVGDQFELLQDMYLYDEMKGYDDMGGKAEFWVLSNRTLGYNPPLVRVVPAGEVVEIMALKMTRLQGYLDVFFQMRSGEKWVLIRSFAWSTGEYKRELCRKITDGLSKSEVQPGGKDSQQMESDEHP